MNLADQLRKIAEGDKREISEIVKRIEEHCEAKILGICLKAAESGKTCVDLGRPILPPPDLSQEGIKFKCDFARMVAYW